MRKPPAGLVRGKSAGSPIQPPIRVHSRTTCPCGKVRSLFSPRLTATLMMSVFVAHQPDIRAALRCLPSPDRRPDPCPDAKVVPHRLSARRSALAPLADCAPTTEPRPSTTICRRERPRLAKCRFIGHIRRSGERLLAENILPAQPVPNRSRQSSEARTSDRRESAMRIGVGGRAGGASLTGGIIRRQWVVLAAPATPEAAARPKTATSRGFKRSHRVRTRDGKVARRN